MPCEYLQPEPTEQFEAPASDTAPPNIAAPPAAAPASAGGNRQLSEDELTRSIRNYFNERQPAFASYQAGIRDKKSKAVKQALVVFGAKAIGASLNVGRSRVHKNEKFKEKAQELGISGVRRKGGGRKRRIGLELAEEVEAIRLHKAGTYEDAADELARLIAEQTADERSEHLVRDIA